MLFSNWEGVKTWECFLSLAQPKFCCRNISMLVQLIRHLDSKRKQKINLKYIYKWDDDNERKTYEEKKLEIWENDQILWKNDDDGTRINEFVG